MNVKHTLSTKKFGKKAMKECVAMLPLAIRYKKGFDMVNFYDLSGDIIAYVVEGDFHSPKCVLTIK